MTQQIAARKGNKMVMIIGDDFDEVIQRMREMQEYMRSRITEAQWKYMDGDERYFLALPDYLERLTGECEPVFAWAPSQKDRLSKLRTEKVRLTGTDTEAAKDQLEEIEYEIEVEEGRAETGMLFCESMWISLISHDNTELGDRPVALLYEISQQAYVSGLRNGKTMTNEVLAELPEEIKKVRWVR